MKVILTGIAGFIGHHVAAKLLAEGHQVVGIDNYNDYYDVRLKEFRTDHLKQLGDVEVHRVDLADYEAVFSVFEASKADCAIHLAAQAGVRYSIDNPHVYTKCNIEAFLNVLESCRHNDVKRLVYASSSSVYGGIKEMPFSESMTVDKPISLYAATKKANELMAHTYTHLYNFETVGLRFFTVYGPLGRPDMAMWLFSDAILNERPIKVFNHGKMQRDFTYVDDIVKGILASAQVTLSNPCEVYNLGNHRSEELEKLISLLEENLGKKALREDLPIQPGDVPKTYADIDKASRDLGYIPETSLDVGVKAFTNWYTQSWLPHVEDLESK